MGKALSALRHCFYPVFFTVTLHYVTPQRYAIMKARRKEHVYDTLHHTAFFRLIRNAIFIRSERTKILVDAGVSGKRLEQALHCIGETPGDIKGILITHEHSDHIQGAGVMSRKYGIPIFATAPTWEACSTKLGNVPARCIKVISKTDFYIDDLMIEPYDIPHDAADPVGTASRAARARWLSPPTSVISRGRSNTACTTATSCCWRPTMIPIC